MKTCFVITPIGEEGTETRKRSDVILKFVIGPACAACGYEPLRADHIPEPGLITSQVIQHVMGAPLVIADLTDRNPNVFYELAVRHVIRKPLIQIIRKGDLIPFDVAATRTIPVDHHDLESVEEAKTEIVRQIKAAEASPQNIENPISVAIDIQSLRQSDKPGERSLAELIEAITEMRKGFALYFASAEQERSFLSDLAMKIEERMESGSAHQEAIMHVFPELAASYHEMMRDMKAQQAQDSAALRFEWREFFLEMRENFKNWSQQKESTPNPGHEADG